MAMEVTNQPKQLSRHAVPVIMIMAAFMVLPISAFIGYNDVNRPTNGSLAKGLVTRVINVRPTPNGLASITLNHSPARTNVPLAGSYLDGNPGRIAQLSLQL